VRSLLGGVTLVGLAAGLVMGFAIAPREATQGNVQRIMYLHVERRARFRVLVASRLIESAMATRPAGTPELGTCRYMMRCTLPWVASRGAIAKPITRPAASPTSVTPPRRLLTRA